MNPALASYTYLLQTPISSQFHTLKVEMRQHLMVRWRARHIMECAEARAESRVWTRPLKSTVEHCTVMMLLFPETEMYWLRQHANSNPNSKYTHAQDHSLSQIDGASHYTSSGVSQAEEIGNFAVLNGNWSEQFVKTATEATVLCQKWHVWGETAWDCSHLDLNLATPVLNGFLGIKCSLWGALVTGVVRWVWVQTLSCFAL